MFKLLFLLFPVFLSYSTFSQSYTSYFTGNSSDVVTSPFGGVCIMGGSTEHDEAMKWFLEQANGGDILVLRTSGSNGYNNYLYSQLGIGVNSVETIVFNNATASNDAYVLQQIQNAEAIWFAGGDQWNYVSYWRNTPIDSLINLALVNKKIVIGGTSAGMAIQGGYYFSAENGTVTSATALNNPYDFDVTVDSTKFLDNDYLGDVITDTHYDNPDRKGRHITFLARIFMDYGVQAKGIACQEYTAVCIDTNGLAKIYGEYPAYDETVYFLQTNCEILDITPEECSLNNPLDWNKGGEAVKVYVVKGTMTGANTFDLSDWQTGSGGVWENWYVDNGVLIEELGSQINCSSVGVVQNKFENDIRLFPNPANETLSVTLNSAITNIDIIDVHGKVVIPNSSFNLNEMTIDISSLDYGFYFVHVKSLTNNYLMKFVKE
jgi:cyanophycinase-like exopeptidase